MNLDLYNVINISKTQHLFKAKYIKNIMTLRMDRFFDLSANDYINESKKHYNR